MSLTMAFYGACLFFGTVAMAAALAFGGNGGEGHLGVLSAGVLVVWGGFGLTQARMSPPAKERDETWRRPV